MDALSVYGIRHIDTPCTPARIWEADSLTTSPACYPALKVSCSGCKQEAVGNRGQKFYIFGKEAFVPTRAELIVWRPGNLTRAAMKTAFCLLLCLGFDIRGNPSGGSSAHAADTPL